MNVLIYGAGQTGEQVYHNIKKQHNVIGFLDGNLEKQGRKIGDVEVLGGVDVIKGKQIKYDKIYIGSIFWKDIKKLLLDNDVSESKIVIEIPEDVGSPTRTIFLENYAKLWDGCSYAVAEGGVFRGEFAAVINRCFPQSKLYLFDTFQGFDKRDISLEEEKDYSHLSQSVFSNTSEELVLSKMKFKDNVEIHKGYFPESAQKVSDSFCFVNLDFDLYQPILEGIRFFWPQMVKQSVLLIHDYYNMALPGVKEAVRDYEAECKYSILKMPIGDGQSIALIKY